MASTTVIYLHGFGGDSSCAVGSAVRAALPAAAVLLRPSYHPTTAAQQGLLPPARPPPPRWHETRLEPFLAELAATVAGLPGGGRAHLVGYSVGGLLAAAFAVRHPELTASLLLLAPAIDNFDRNFKVCCHSGGGRCREACSISSSGERGRDGRTLTVPAAVCLQLGGPASRSVHGQR